MVETPATQVPAGNVAPATPGSATPVTPEPAKTVQPAPVAPKPGDAPEGDKKETQTVPLATLMEERSKRQSLEAEITLMKQQSQAQQPLPPIQQYQQPPNQVAEEIDKLWDTDPRKGVQAEIMLAMDWYDRTNNTIDQQADSLSAKYSDFDKWRTNATRYVRALPLQQRSQPGALEMAYFIVRGQNVDDILKQQNEDLMRKFQTGELAGMVSTPPGAVGSPAPVPGIQLSEDQRRAANAMGVPEEEYIKWFQPPGGK